MTLGLRRHDARRLSWFARVRRARRHGRPDEGMRDGMNARNPLISWCLVPFLIPKALQEGGYDGLAPSEVAVSDMRVGAHIRRDGFLHHH